MPGMFTFTIYWMLLSIIGFFIARWFFRLGNNDKK